MGKRKWTREELYAAFKAYLEMQRFEKAGKKFIKKQIYRRLAEQHGRSTQAFERRMMNISYIFKRLGKKHIKGLLPAKNVGNNVMAILVRFARDEEMDSFNKKVDEICREMEVDEPQKPVGVDKPRAGVVETAVYSRDPDVRGYLLAKSKGYCEHCARQAPFVKDDGQFYLEVHHLKRLADGGSDTVENAVAVCPNCHRRFHYARDRAESLENVYSSVPRLKRE